MIDFTLPVKSTLDKLAHDLAQTGGLEAVDLDDSAASNALFGSENPAVVWSLLSLVERPRDPLYTVSFEIGAKTSLDPSHYQSLNIVDEIRSAFYVGMTIAVYDYSTPTPPTEQVGYMIVTGAGTRPAQHEKDTGLRMVSVSARAVRMN